jgi:hypothetical protein
MYFISRRLVSILEPNIEYVSNACVDAFLLCSVFGNFGEVKLPKAKRRCPGLTSPSHVRSPPPRNRLSYPRLLGRR